MNGERTVSEADVVAAMPQLRDVDWLTELLADEFGQGWKPPQLKVAANFVAHHVVNWSELSGFDESDLPSAIVRAARRKFHPKALRAAVRREVAKQWPRLERELQKTWDELS